jgi:hypothetical protein
LAGGLGPGQGRQEQGRQDRNDGNNDQEFDEGKAKTTKHSLWGRHKRNVVANKDLVKSYCVDR